MITYNRSSHSDLELKDLYTALLKPRMVEEKMLILLRQGRISKWFSGIGQEAITIGTTMALKEDEYILPMHRNLGVFTTRKVPLARLFSQFQGKMNGFSKGRERSFHFGTKEHHIVGMISHLGPQLALADGIALANKLNKSGQATIVFTGEGGTSEGDFHEALNVAAVWDLPVIFVIENNGWGLSTPTSEQYRAEKLADRGIGYGMEAHSIDGNNILEVHNTISEIAERIRKNPKPVLVECNTFRIRGHEEASGTKYYPEGIQDEWAKKDPIENFEAFLLKEKIIDTDFIDGLRVAFKKEIDESLEVAFAEELPHAETFTEEADMFMPFEEVSIAPNFDKQENKRLVDAISEGLRQSMERHDNLVIMGQDVAEYGGVFKITDGFLEQFGKDRVRNTPICESAIVSAALGLSIKGYKSVVEMQFADFVTSGFNPIVNNLAKMYYRWGQNADVVVRMPTGAGVGAGPFHSQSNEAWFTKVPGLKVVYPAFPADAKGLLASCIEEPNPILFFEHKALYRSLYGDVPTDYFTLPIGKASLVKEGTDMSIITYGAGVHWALEFLNKHPEVSADLLDLRTLRPLDVEAIYATAKKTGRVIILHEDTLFGGLGGEISAMITETCFKHLDAPVMRSASIETAVPFSKHLEENFLPKSRFEEQALALLAF
ncbi:MAG: 2-oxoisovalerate dehydrogenase E1 component [Flavobacteriales bacterium]|jgi:2-oxoisovalerate dehydrogenase E1 component